MLLFISLHPKKDLIHKYSTQCLKYNAGIKLSMAATHIKNGDDGGVVPTNDVGNIFGLWDLGGYQLWKIGNMQRQLNTLGCIGHGELDGHILFNFKANLKVDCWNPHHDFRWDEVLSFTGHSLHLPLLLPVSVLIQPFI